MWYQLLAPYVKANWNISNYLDNLSGASTIAMCPSERGGKAWDPSWYNTAGHLFYFSYGMNYFAIVDDPNSWYANEPSRSIDAIARPTEKPAIACLSLLIQGQPYFDNKFRPDRIAFIHHKKSNMVFFDGHVEAWTQAQFVTPGDWNTPN